MVQATEVYIFGRRRNEFGQEKGLQTLDWLSSGGCVKSVKAVERKDTSSQSDGENSNSENGVVSADPWLPEHGAKPFS